MWTLDEVATYCGVRPWTIRRWVRDKGFPIMRLGHKTLRFDKRAVDEWARRRAEGES